MEYFSWSSSKNERLKKERNVSFEEVIFNIEQGHLLDIIQHPNQKKYKGQKILVVELRNYVYLVPCVEIEEGLFLKTIIPSRKMTKKYLNGGGAKW